MIKFSGRLGMKILKQIMFIYEDGSSDAIDDPRACALFQSRCNSAGILSGMEDYVVPLTPSAEDAEQTK